MPKRFSESDTERYYDQEDASYRTFWDKEGSLHWGYFDSTTGDDFSTASARLNDVMLVRSGIETGSTVLDLGCGNGNTSIWLAQQRECRVTGVDLSGVRVQNALDAAARQPKQISDRIAFRKASATDLPFEEGGFTHVWSQAAIYHVPDKRQVLAEAHRVLRKDGTLIIDDLTKPKPRVSAQAQKYVYDRLLFDTPFSFDGYQDGLRHQGFDIVEAEDLSPHLMKSYRLLGAMAQAATDQGRGDFSGLVEAYRYMVAAVEDGELGWAMYVCRK